MKDSGPQNLLAVFFTHHLATCTQFLNFIIYNEKLVDWYPLAKELGFLGHNV
jgi:hypothetical protein